MEFDPKNSSSFYIRKILNKKFIKYKHFVGTQVVMINGNCIIVYKVTINNKHSQITWTDSVKYLSVTMDRKLSQNTLIYTIINTLIQ